VPAIIPKIKAKAKYFKVSPPKKKIATKTKRVVKENTVLLNLSNKKYFLKASQGYIVRKA